MKTFITTLFLVFISNNSFANESPVIKLPGFCSVRINNMIEVSVNFHNEQVNTYDYGDNLIKGEVMLDSGYVGGNTCQRYEDGEYGCTQVGVSEDRVILKVKKNGVIKIKSVLGSEYDTGFTDVESILYRKLMLRTKFKYEDGRIYVIRNLKKTLMNCR